MHELAANIGTEHLDSTSAYSAALLRINNIDSLRIEIVFLSVLDFQLFHTMFVLHNLKEADAKILSLLFLNVI